MIWPAELLALLDALRVDPSTLDAGAMARLGRALAARDASLHPRLRATCDRQRQTIRRLELRVERLERTPADSSGGPRNG
ncbi:MAG: hypothetical protein IT508_10890 [Burkholderiaceae bacterium]|jgi:hypothetical protein|nr:hypothetical protein [Burkholderiaceae bacterium]